ncbi:MAG: TetR/AcrR family transcriptional regulator [Muribaculaceae bacterium]|nr:TetR/AcrR family transcriptional regulator [Alistipes senegalensis]MCM1474034.1 TetR/AcrR family transcriptional regulator [Muribaculaceae bacterium]
MKENKVEIILNSAEELMCTMETPNRDITVDMIAKNAGIGKGSIYYYFESKEEIIDAVIERSYSSAIREYFNVTNNCSGTYEKLKLLFASMIRKEFQDNSRNLITSLHVQDDIILHYKLMMTAIKTVSPILTEILKEGVSDGSIHTETPTESAEMIVAMLTFLLNRSFFPSDDASMYRKLKLYAHVLETSLETEKGSFSFLFTKPE